MQVRGGGDTSRRPQAHISRGTSPARTSSASGGRTGGASKECTSPSTGQSEKRQSRRSRHSHAWALRAGQFQGEVRVGFHNCRGWRKDPVKRLNYLRRMSEKFDIFGLSETAADGPTQVGADVHAAEVGLRMIWGEAARPCSGVALAVSKKLKVTDERVVWRDPAGRTLIVELTLHELLPLTVVVSYAPSQGDWDRKRYFRRIMSHLPAGGGERRVMWMGDFNMIEDESLDCDAHEDAPDGRRAREEMLEAYAAAARKLAGAADGGLLDVYREVHPFGRDVTSRGLRRIDRILMSPALVHGMPGVVASDHIEQTELQVLGQYIQSGTKLVAAPDHKAARVTLRFSSTPRAKSKWQYAEARLTAASHKAVGSILAEHVACLTPSVSAAASVVEGGRVTLELSISTPVFDTARMEAWQGECRERLRKEERQQKKERFAERDALRKKLKGLEWSLRQGRTRLTNGEWRALQEMRRKCKAKLAKWEERHQNAASGARARVSRWAENGSTKPLFETVSTAAAVTLPIERLREIGPDGAEHVANGQEEVAGVATRHWGALFNLPPVDAPEGSAEELLRVISEDDARQVPADLLPILDVQAIISVKSIEKAIDAVNAEAVAGKDGFGPRFYKAWRGQLALALHSLYSEMLTRGSMVESMREAVITILYKGKGMREWCKAYRPVSVTSMEYRVLGKAVEMRLAKVVPRVLSGSNVGFVPGARIEDDALLTAGLANHCDTGKRGGALVYLDNEKAYDRVRIAFLLDTLRAFGFPPSFVRLIEIMYTGLVARLKVNGHVGEQFTLGNGLRQGCPASCLLFLLVQEVLLRRIATDKGTTTSPALEGVRLPTRAGVTAREVRERAYADDTKVWLKNMEQVSRLREIVSEFEAVSGQRLNIQESVGVRFGSEKGRAVPEGAACLKKWIDFGGDEIDKCLGMVLGTPTQVAAQWEAKVTEVEKAALDLQAGRKPRTMAGRSTIVKSKLVSSALFTMGLQVPAYRARQAAIARLQRAADDAMWGRRGLHAVEKHVAPQRYDDGGVRHLDVAAKLQAVWAEHAVRLVQPGDEPWKELWWHGMRQVYGRLAGPALVESTCGFHLLRQTSSQAVTELQRVAFQALGSLRAPTTESKEVTPTTCSSNGALSATPRSPWHGVKAQWTVPQVAERRLFFDPCLRRTGGFERDTVELEREALQWAREGLVCVRDVLNGTCFVGSRELTRQHPTLSVDTFRKIMADMPPQWSVALGSGEGVDDGLWSDTWDGAWRALAPPQVRESSKPTESRSKDARRKDEPPPSAAEIEAARQEALAAPQRVYITKRQTLHVRPGTEVVAMRQSDVYDCLVTEYWRMPRAFDGTHADAHYAHLFSHWNEAHRGPPIALAMSRARHSSVPAHMTDVAVRLAHSGFLIGPVKCQGLRAKCHCEGRQHDETIEHAYMRCARVQQLWKWVLAAWARVTGETKLKADDMQVVMLGDRIGTWLDECEQSEFGAYSAPWAVVHKATLYVIKCERDRAAAPRGKACSAASMYARVQREVQRVVGDLWHKAQQTDRRARSSDATTRFRGLWVATGFVEMRGVGTQEGHAPRVALFARAMGSVARRDRKEAAEKARTRREQEHEPPPVLPSGTCSLYTDGSFVKKDKNDPGNAGYGVSAVACGDGDTDENAQEICALCAPLRVGSESVEKLSNNTAELRGVIEALRLAQQRRQPAIIRYDSKYAAMITTNVWRAKKHKALAAVARAEWQRARVALKGKLWLRHVKGHSGHKWNDRADKLADEGRCGVVRIASPRTVD